MQFKFVKQLDRGMAYGDGLFETISRQYYMLNQVNQRFKFDIKLRFYMEGKSGRNFQ